MLKTIKGLQGVRTLNKSEQKAISGGKQMSCSCIGSVGTWTGNYTPGSGQVWADIHTYCSSGHGWCNTVQA